MRPVTCIAATIALAAGLLTACSSSGEGSISAHLESFPPLDTDQYMLLYYTDYDRLAQQTGVERPSGEDPDEDEEWYADVLGLGQEFQDVVAGHHPRPFVTQHSRTFELDAVDGIELTQVDSFLQAMDGTLSMRGDIEASALTEELGEPDDGLWDASDGQGTGGLFAEIDDYLVSAGDEDALRDRQDGGASAADDEGLLAVADALDDAEVYAAQLIRWDAEVLDNAGVTVTGLGLSRDDETSVLTFVYGHDDSEPVQDTAERAEAFLEGDAVARHYVLQDVEVDGQVVIATLEVGDDAPLNHVWGLANRYDPILFGGTED